MKHEHISEAAFGMVIDGRIKADEIEPDDLAQPYGLGLELTRDGAGEADLYDAIGMHAVSDAKAAATDTPENTNVPEFIRSLRTSAARARAADQLRTMVGKLEHGEEVDVARGIAIFEPLQTHSANSYKPTPLADHHANIDIGDAIWRPWVPKGLLTLIVGDQEAGKSNLCLQLANVVANDLDLPDGSKSGAPGPVVWVETEARQEQTKVRVRDYGIDLANFVSPFRERHYVADLESAEDVQMIENAVRQSDASLVVVDSLMGAMEEENKPIAKRLPKLLGHLAERNDCGVITTHFPRKLGKGEKRKRLTVHDIRGFGGIAGFFSSVIAVDTPDPRDDTLRRVYIIKGERALEFGFRVLQSGAVWRFEWADPAEAPVRKLKKDMASDLLDRMCKNGRRLVRDIEAAGKVHEPPISKTTLRRAKRDKGMKTDYEGLEDRYWGF